MNNLQIIKTRTTRYNVTQVAINFMDFNERYRQIRGNYKYKGFGCYSCNRNFKDGEKISLIITNGGNKTVCRECGVKFKKELDGEEDGN